MPDGDDKSESYQRMRRARVSGIPLMDMIRVDWPGVTNPPMALGV
jgi:hypothetical protein